MVRYSFEDTLAIIHKVLLKRVAAVTVSGDAVNYHLLRAPCWLRALFAWREVRSCGVWLYEENAITGARRATRLTSSVWGPQDIDWLKRRPAWRPAGPPPPAHED